MENFIYILIPIAFFLFKTYRNFIKEQEKAKNRNPPKPILSHDVQNRTEVIGQDIMPELKEAPFDSTDFLNEKKEAQKRRAGQLKAAQKTPKNEVKDYYNPETPAEEVLEGRRLHAAHHHEFEFPRRERDATIDFDLRDAVIQQAIMNRPYN